MSVGQGFGAFKPGLKVSRLPKNPMDKCTIVSVYPRAIRDHKVSVFPGSLKIEAAPDGEFSLLVVGSASWYKEQQEGMPMLEVPISSMQVAEGFIRDYCNGLLGYTPNTSMIGLFYIPGEWDFKSIVTYKTPDGKTFKDLLKEARDKQNNWFKAIVNLSDTMWARSNGNPNSIGLDARLAAEKLGLKDKPWMQDFQSFEKKNCLACGTMVNPNFPVCPTCKAIVDEVKAKELNIKFAS